MPIGNCYCGNINIDMPRKPKQFTDCNSSICRKYGALWAYFLKKFVKISLQKKDSISYSVESNKSRMQVAYCELSGCVTHYDWGKKQRLDKMMAVNGRIFDLDLLESILVKKLDGARRWDYKKGPPAYPIAER